MRTNSNGRTFLRHTLVLRNEDRRVRHGVGRTLTRSMLTGHWVSEGSRLLPERSRPRKNHTVEHLSRSCCLLAERLCACCSHHSETVKLELQWQSGMRALSQCLALRRSRRSQPVGVTCTPSKLSIISNAECISRHAPRICDGVREICRGHHVWRLVNSSLKMSSAGCSGRS